MCIHQCCPEGQQPELEQGKLRGSWGYGERGVKLTSQKQLKSSLDFGSVFGSVLIPTSEHHSIHDIIWSFQFSSGVLFYSVPHRANKPRMLFTLSVTTKEFFPTIRLMGTLPELLLAKEPLFVEFKKWWNLSLLQPKKAPACSRTPAHRGACPVLFCTSHCFGHIA